MIRRAALLLALAAAFALDGGAGAQESPPKHPRYDFRVDARIVPTERAAHVTLELGKGAEHVHRLRFRIDPQRQLLFRGDGEVKTEGAHVTWTPPRSGGKLTYVFRIDHLARWSRTAPARAPGCASACPRAGASPRPTPSCVRASTGSRTAAAACRARPAG